MTRAVTLSRHTGHRVELPINDHVEAWAPIAEAPSYQVSTWGRVRRRIDEKLNSEYFDVASWPNAKGYRLVSLEIAGQPRLRYVHRLVLTTFRGAAPGRPYVNHEDLQKGHNDLGNLEWTTPMGNAAHYRRARARAAGQLELVL